MEQKKLRKQYHPAFCAAVEQIFEHDSCDYAYEEEYSLNTLPNRIDLLITKEDAQRSKSGLGKIFKKYNLFEYKSPGQPLGVKEYKKVMGYAYLFASKQSGVDMEDITISFVREGKPVNLLRYFELKGFKVKKYEEGIYHIKKAGQVDVQIVVTRKLGQKYIWLKALTGKLTHKEMVSLSEKAAIESSTEDHGRIACIMDLVVLLNSNKEWMKELIEMGALRDLFQAEFDEKDREIQSLSKQLKRKDEQLQSRDEQLQNKDEQLKKLRQEIDQLKKQLNKIAVL